MKKKAYLLFSVAVLLASLFGTARPAMAWACSGLTSSSWLCNEGNSYYFVEYQNGAYTYTPF